MKRSVIVGLALIFIILGIMSSRNVIWNKKLNTLQISPQNNIAFALELADCICCHGSTVDRHHRLAESRVFECLDCHEILFDEQTQSYNPEVIRDCLVCHEGGVPILDRHHILAENDQAGCFDCHEAVFDPETGTYFIDIIQTCDDTNQGSSESHYAAHNVELNDCTSCHLSNLFDQHNEQCDRCHMSTSQTVQDAILNQTTQCTACHSEFVHSMQCQICHTNQTYKPNKKEQTHKRHMARVSCGVCHKIPETTNLEPTGQYCALCHGRAKSYDTSMLPGLHRSHMLKREYFPYACYMCHGQSVPQTQPSQCIPCHDNREYAYDPSQLDQIHHEHNRRFDCSNCHYNPRLFGTSQTVPCSRCHEDRTYTSVHEVHSLHLGRQCWSCHPSANVSARAGHTCISCHGTAVSYSSSTDVHKQHDAKGYQCWVCHQQLVPMYVTTCRPVDDAYQGTIQGVVSDSTGSLVEGATVMTTPGGYLALTASDGSYELCVASETTYSVTAYKIGYLSDRRTVTVLTDQTVIENFTVTALPPGTITGMVTQTDGTPVDGATVSTDIGGYATTTMSDGTYSLTVIPTQYIVTASAGNKSNSKLVSVESNQTYVTDFIIGNGGGNNEICDDTIDNDGDGLIDCNDSNCNSTCSGCSDTDSDTFFSGGALCSPADCDDTNTSVNPAATEICDGIDNNCDSTIDENLTTMYYQDSDNDGFGDPNISQDACSLPAGYATDNTDCNDTDPAINPGAAEVCNSIDDNCDSSVDEGFDADGDGYTTCGGDCNDSNPGIKPDAVDDTCNSIDENCSGSADEDYVPQNTSCGTGVCASTGTTSCVAGVEQDSCTPGSPTESPETTCSDGLDNDCNGSADTADLNCQPPCTDNDGDGFSVDGGACGQIDCNDTNPGINPGAIDDTCNGIDEDCDSIADDAYISQNTACGTGICASIGTTSCAAGVEQDNCTPGLPTESPETTCSDGLDNDCDGLTDTADQDCQPPGGACSEYTDETSCTADASCEWNSKKNRCKDAGGGGNIEICDDGIDNDGDGQVDCDDSDCDNDAACSGGGDPPTEPEICDDGIDNDGDGKTDCADRGDCKRDPACT